MAVAMDRYQDVVVEERIDRNGTKHQVVNTACDRCGGLGGHNVWKATGWTCFKCGGTGRMLQKRKVYTPEHRAKLDAQREKREEKKRQQIIAEAQEKNIETLASWGYGQEKIYVVLGNTFSIKDELKEKGARFNRQVMSWFFTEPTADYETYELETAKLVKYTELGEVRVNHDDEVYEYIKAQKNKNAGDSNHVGTEGEKIEVELTLVDSFTFDTQFGWTCVNKMKDSDGNILVWKTKSDLCCQYGAGTKVIVKGTIKEHSEYNGEKQTVLTRCKVKEGN